MDNKKSSNFIEKSIINESSIDSDLKEKLYEYLIETYRTNDIHDENFIITIPGSYTNDFGINHIYRIHDGHIEKTSNEIYAAHNYGVGKWKSHAGSVNRKPGARSTGKYNTAKVSIVKPSDEFSELKMMIESLKESVNKLTKENTLIKELLFSNAATYNDSKTIQTIPIDIYIDTNNSQEIFEVYDSVLRFANTFSWKCGTRIARLSNAVVELNWKYCCWLLL